MKAATVGCLLLAGCAGGIRQPSEVLVPVHVPCVGSLPEKPVSEFENAAELSMFEQVRSLLIDREQDKIYKAELEAVIAGCQ